MIHWLNIIAGLILCVGFLEAIPLMGKHLSRFSKWLGRFDTIVGIVLLIVVIFTGYWSSIYGIITILASLILMIGILPSIPAIGKSLEKVAKWLGGFQGIIGIMILVLGILGIIGYI